MARSSDLQTLSLLDWPERVEIARLQAKRDELIRRIRDLPRFSFRRVELEARLAALTAMQLERERDLIGRHREGGR